MKNLVIENNKPTFEAIELAYQAGYEEGIKEGRRQMTQVVVTAANTTPIITCEFEESTNEPRYIR